MIFSMARLRKKCLSCINGTLSFHSIITFLFLSSLLIFLFPILVQWNLVDVANSPPVLSALQSSEYQTSLVVSVSMSAPMFLELLLRIFLNAKLEYVLPNTIILASLAIPNIIILTYINVSFDLNALNYLLKARLLLLMWLALSFIRKYGGKKWSSKGLIICFTFLCVARIMGFYKGYYSRKVHDTLNILGTIADVIAFITFILMSVKWYRFIFTETKFVTMTNHQYLCNIYVTAVTITCIGLYINTYSSSNSIDWYNVNKNSLTITSMMFTSFYMIVLLFEGRALQREMLQTKVLQNYIIIVCFPMK